MQTFIVNKDHTVTAQSLDYRRLGKQRVEAIQIAQTILGTSNGRGWANHPAVKMWKPYIGHLIWKYLPAMIDEWERRGYNGPKCKEHLSRLQELVPYRTEFEFEPPWLNNDLIVSHKSNLIRKLSEHYAPKFPNIPNDLEYIWPV